VGGWDPTFHEFRVDGGTVTYEWEVLAQELPPASTIREAVGFVADVVASAPHDP
jgi:hypothetical protein